MLHATEDTLVQDTTANYLKDQLHWDESIHAQYNETFGKEGTLGRDSERDVVLSRYLGEKLIELNPGLPESAYQDALRAVKDYAASPDILTTNKELYQLHKDGVEVSFKDDEGQLVKRHLRLFDFDNPENNHFLVVRELWVQGSTYRRRADIVGFVNGLPLVFMEVKNLDKDLRDAYDGNLSDYKDNIPQLLHHNALIILGNGIDAKVGSLSSRFEHFHQWKRLDEEEEGVVNMETLLKGLCSKANLMDVFENFILFDESTDALIKIVARNHQYLGVNNAIKGVPDRHQRGGKLGVFWHTQGSGKSYSMVFFSRKVHRKLGGNYSFLVVTDRDDLDTQIYNTYAGCGVVNNDQDPCRPKNGKALRKMLGEHKGYVFTLIQKFNQRVEPEQPYSRRDDVIVISDEAHRSQYGDLSVNMRNALPDASYIGFTGTPLFTQDGITYETFGDPVSTYDFKRAVDDGATVPLYYDARGDELVFKDGDGNEQSVAGSKELNERIAEKLEELDVQDEDIERQLERALKREYHIITAKSRLEQVARDFVQHYANGWESGKAMMICIDKVTCGRMYQLVEQYWQEHIAAKEADLDNAKDEQDLVWRTRQIEWMKETLMSMVVSEEQGEVQKFKQWGVDIIPHRKLIKQGYTLANGKRLPLEDAFKKKRHPFRIAIVCNMWLTGFDVPSLSTLYLDKPLKAHTLMQAIARANRVDEGKANGLIVDYCGILKALKKALKTFAGKGDSSRGKDVSNYDPTKPKTELLTRLQEAITMVREFLVENGFDQFDDILTTAGFERNALFDKAKEAVNQNDRTRQHFEVMAREVFKTYKASINVPGIHRFYNDRAVIRMIYKLLRKDHAPADIAHILQALQGIVDDSIGTYSIGQNDDQRPIDISAIDFDRLQREFKTTKTPHTTVQTLKSAIAERLRLLLTRNPGRTDLQTHYDQMVKDYNAAKNRTILEQTFEALLQQAQDLSEEEQRAAREGLDEETLAVFDMLKKPDLDESDIDAIKKVATSLLTALKNGSLKAALWREKESTRDEVKQRIFDFLYDENTGLPVTAYEEDEIQVVSDTLYQHVYRVYPCLPSPIYGQTHH